MPPCRHPTSPATRLETKLCKAPPAARVLVQLFGGGGGGGTVVVGGAVVVGGGAVVVPLVTVTVVVSWMVEMTVFVTVAIVVVQRPATEPTAPGTAAKPARNRMSRTSTNKKRRRDKVLLPKPFPLDRGRRPSWPASSARSSLARDPPESCPPPSGRRAATSVVGCWQR